MNLEPAPASGVGQCATAGVAADTRLTGHMAGLDGVRGLAVIMVMGVHFVGNATAYSPWQKMIVKAAGYGTVGVDLFFVLSGFLITNLLLESKGGPHYFRNFYARRTLRIFPLYYLVLACLFVVLPRLTTPSPLLEMARAHQIWAWTYTSNFYTAWQSSWDPLNYISHFWSLAIEEQFYLLWPLIVFCFSRPKLEQICLAVVMFALGLRIALVLAGVSELSISVLTPCRLDTLCVGAFLALRIRHPDTFSAWVQKSNRYALILGATVVAVMAFGSLTQFALPIVHQVRNSLIAVFFGALILLALKPHSNPVAWVCQGPVLRFFGKYSYGLYVYHGILTWYLFEIQAEERLDAAIGDHSLTMATQAVIGVTVSLMVAVPSYHLFEKRFLALKRYFNDAGAPRSVSNKRSRPTTQT